MEPVCYMYVGQELITSLPILGLIRFMYKKALQLFKYY